MTLITNSEALYKSYHNLIIALSPTYDTNYSDNPCGFGFLVEKSKLDISKMLNFRLDFSYRLGCWKGEKTKSNYFA